MAARHPDVVARIRDLMKREHNPSKLFPIKALDGTDLKELGIPAGPQLGEILRYLLEEVLDCPEVNNQADLKALAEKGGFLVDAPPDAGS